MATTPTMTAAVDPWLRPVQVKLFAGVIYCDRKLLAKAGDLLQDEFGAIDRDSLPFAFEGSRYYAREMGGDPKRVLLSFGSLIHAGRLAEIKLSCNHIENQLRDDAGSRTINIDPGYLDFGKVVLASMKPNNAKIYLDKEVYADLTLLFKKGKYSAFDWTFPDFRAGTYDAVLLDIRKRYKRQIQLLREQEGKE